MELFRWRHHFAILISGLFTILAFQNCSPMSFKTMEGTDVSSLNLNDPINTEDSFVDHGPGVGIGTGHAPNDDGSEDAIEDAFEEVFMLEETVEEEYVENTIRSSWECRFVLRGEKSAEWSVIRYNASGDCDLEEAAVRTNNPKATVIGKSKVFVKDPMGPATPSASHWACNFTLKGALGNTWSVIRNVANKEECASQIPIVRTNNPNATIIKQTVTFVSVATQSKSKWMCYYTLRGQKGYEWNSERESTDSKSCAAQTAIVRANNPKATIIKIVGPNFLKL